SPWASPTETPSPPPPSGPAASSASSGGDTLLFAAPRNCCDYSTCRPSPGRRSRSWQPGRVIPKTTLFQLPATRGVSPSGASGGLAGDQVELAGAAEAVEVAHLGEHLAEGAAADVARLERGGVLVGGGVGLGVAVALLVGEILVEAHPREQPSAEV